MMRRGWLVEERYSGKLVLMWICWLISTDLIYRYRVKIATSRIRASFPTGGNERLEGAAMWVM